jgi:hypothetical protein
MADDEPYVILADGEPTGVVEIPVQAGPGYGAEPWVK